ncbi:MAG: hypothetical protein ACNS63_02130, partial [Candidatus Nitrospinota bacterium M3_3B_026]
MIDWLNAPGILSGKSTIGSDMSYILSVAFTLLFLISGLLARRGMGLAHHRMMLVSMLAMFGYFVFYYEVRRLGVASLADQAGFEGPVWVYRRIFRPALYFHFLMVTLSSFSAIYMIFNGFRTASARDGKMTLEERAVKRSGRLWLAGFAWLAFLSWWAFSHPRLDLWHRAMILSFGYFLPAAMALAVGRLLPDSARRHRTLG